MPKSKRMMMLLICLMMAGGVLYWQKEERGAAAPIIKASGETEAFFAVRDGAGERREQAEETLSYGTADADGWIYATEALLVNINTADAAELEKLPGIGPAKAAAILLYRQEHGDFAKTEDLMRVPGIKAATYAKLEAYVTV